MRTVKVQSIEDRRGRSLMSSCRPYRTRLLEPNDFIPGVIPDVAGSWVELMTTIPQLMPDLLPAYRPSEIVYGGKRYILREPMECVVRWDDEGGDFLWVEYNPLEIFGTGYTVDEAIDLFGMTFADMYKWTNRVHAHMNEPGAIRLGERFEWIRCRLNELVVSVMPVNH